jgi:hypothetical protein
VAAYNWGLVNGKSQTIYPWDSWVRHYTNEPTVWFHDIFRADGRPFSTDEVQLIRNLTGRGIGINEQPISKQSASVAVRKEN